jgi:hypothetical protein
MDNYFLQEKTCKKCNTKKHLFDFNATGNVCKNCLNWDKRKKNQKLGADKKNKHILKW